MDLTAAALILWLNIFNINGSQGGYWDMDYIRSIDQGVYTVQHSFPDWQLSQDWDTARMSGFLYDFFVCCEDAQFAVSVHRSSQGQYYVEVDGRKINPVTLQVDEDLIDKGRADPPDWEDAEFVQIHDSRAFMEIAANIVHYRSW